MNNYFLQLLQRIRFIFEDSSKIGIPSPPASVEKLQVSILSMERMIAEGSHDKVVLLM